MKSDSTLLAGGFGLCGVPNTLINEVHATKRITGLTAVSNNRATTMLAQSSLLTAALGFYRGDGALSLFLLGALSGPRLIFP